MSFLEFNVNDNGQLNSFSVKRHECLECGCLYGKLQLKFPFLDNQPIDSKIAWVCSCGRKN